MASVERPFVFRRDPANCGSADPGRYPRPLAPTRILCMPTSIKTLLAVALTLAAALPFASSASAARHMEVAVQDDSVLVHQIYYGRKKALVRARQLHATRIRAN